MVEGRPRAMIEIQLQDGRTFPGRVEDLDKLSDLATVRIDCKNLPVIRLGNSSDIRPGEFVVALGSPLALSNTITTGVVSTVARDQKVLPTHLRLSWKTTTFLSGLFSVWLSEWYGHFTVVIS